MAKRKEETRGTTGTPRDVGFEKKAIAGAKGVKTQLGGDPIPRKGKGGETADGRAGGKKKKPGIPTHYSGTRGIEGYQKVGGRAAKGRKASGGDNRR